MRTMARDNLHELVEMLPRSEWETAHHVLRALIESSDPFLKALADAPEDDEVAAAEERLAVDDAKQAMRNGEILSHDEIRREIGL